MGFSVGNADWLDHIVTRVELHRAVNELDRVTVELDPGDGSDLEACMAACLPGGTWTLSNEAGEWSGDVVRVSVRAGELPARVVVVGLSALHRLRPVRISGTYETTVEGLLSELVRGSGLTLSPQQVLTDIEPIVLLDEPALSVLRRLADSRDLVYATSGSTLVVRPRSAKPLLGDANLSWGEVVDVELCADVSDVVGGVDAVGTDPLTGVVASYNTVATDFPGYSGGDTGATLRKNGTRQDLRVALDVGFSATRVSEVKARAVGELTRRAASFLRAEVLVTRARPGEPGGEITVSDAPWPLGGPFRIAGITLVREGEAWSTRFSAFSDSLPARSLL